jgi:hypothetical protein
LERSDNPGKTNQTKIKTLKGFRGWRTLSGLNGLAFAIPGFSLRSNPGLKLANAFGVKAKIPQPTPSALKQRSLNKRLRR